jgi:hypothetical protein
MKISLVKPEKELCWRDENEIFLRISFAVRPRSARGKEAKSSCGIITTILCPSILSILSRELIFADQQAFAASPKRKLSNIPKLPTGEEHTVPPANYARSYDHDLIVRIS